MDVFTGASAMADACPRKSNKKSRKQYMPVTPTKALYAHDMYLHTCIHKYKHTGIGTVLCAKKVTKTVLEE